MRKHRRDYVLSNPIHAKESNLKISKIALEEIQTLFPKANGSGIAGYWTMGHEVDALPLMHELLALEYSLALPKANGTDSHLNFCEWSEDMEMEESDLGFSYPATETCQLIPSLIIVPLVAFDGRGYRLGYGKGYYDKTLDLLYHKDPNIKTMGLAYSMQRVDELPAEAHDIKLDLVATEEGILRFHK